jgi:uncharacterized protein YdeI (YjbR/CyaY-like superfamily)
MTWSESVDEALCFGWIDAIRRRVDENTYSIRFTHRKPTSIWSAINVRKALALRAAGKMTPAGERAFAHRTAAKTGVYSFERNDAAVLPPAFARRFRAAKAAHAYFEAQPPWYRRTSIHWVISAKKEETRERRLATLIEDSAAERWIGPLRRRLASSAWRMRWSSTSVPRTSTIQTGARRSRSSSSTRASSTPTAASGYSSRSPARSPTASSHAAACRACTRPPAVFASPCVNPRASRPRRGSSRVHVPFRQTTRLLHAARDPPNACSRMTAEGAAFQISTMTVDLSSRRCQTEMV